MARKAFRKLTNIAPFVAASFQSDLFLMMSRPRSHDLAQFLFRISLLTIRKLLDVIHASYFCIVSNSTSIPLSIGRMFCLYSAGLRFGFLNQSITAMVPFGFNSLAAAAMNFAIS